jgi:hypothetical protein
VQQQKNVGTAMILAIVFGPLGLLYSSVTGGVVMFILSLFVAVATLGVGLVLTWLVCIFWAYKAATDYNARIDAQARAAQRQ